MNVINKFWLTKNQSLQQFVTDAYNNEYGVSNFEMFLSAYFTFFQEKKLKLQAPMPFVTCIGSGDVLWVEFSS